MVTYSGKEDDPTAIYGHVMIVVLFIIRPVFIDFIFTLWCFSQFWDFLKMAKANKIIVLRFIFETDSIT